MENHDASVSTRSSDLKKLSSETQRDDFNIERDTWWTHVVCFCCCVELPCAWMWVWERTSLDLLGRNAAHSAALEMQDKTMSFAKTITIPNCSVNKYLWRIHPVTSTQVHIQRLKLEIFSDSVNLKMSCDLFNGNWKPAGGNNVRADELFGQCCDVCVCRSWCEHLEEATMSSPKTLCPSSGELNDCVSVSARGRHKVTLRHGIQNHDPKMNIDSVGERSKVNPPLGVLVDVAWN